MRRVKHLIFWLVVIGVILLLFSSHVIAENDFHRQRYALVEIIKAEVKETGDFLNQEALDERVIDALLKVPRHEFVRDTERPYAYANRPLPIGHGQTISQPYIVAVMTDLLKLKKKPIGFWKSAPVPGTRRLFSPNWLIASTPWKLLNRWLNRPQKTLNEPVMTPFIPASATVITAGKKPRLLTALSLPPLPAIYRRR